EVTDFADYLKSSKPAAGFEEVFYPGEIEYLHSKKVASDGISVEDSTWSKLIQLADDFGISEQLDLNQYH
ncbi:MAG: Ldh family oxidoreductase, partial [Chloroflexota bacterium]|nr:Ldh family oxidoreductase [Chloroflexota bacterium]